MFKKLLNYFLNGLLITIPLFIIVYLFYVSFVQFDSFLRETILKGEYNFPGLGLLTFILIISAVGFLSTTFLFRPLFKWFVSLLERIPLLKTVYTAVTDLLSAFVGKKKRFDKPVLVKMTEHSEVERIGFITDEDLKYLDNNEGKIGVYLPYSYGIMGTFIIVPKRNVESIEKSASEVMKYIVSGGISETEDNSSTPQ